MIIALQCVCIALAVANAVQLYRVRSSVQEVQDRLGFGISVPISDLPKVMQTINSKVNERRGKAKRKTTLVDDLAKFDESEGCL